MPERRRSFFQPIWNAIGLAAVAYLAWIGFTTLRERNAGSTQVVTIGPTLLEQVRKVGELTLIEHNNMVEMTVTDTPKSWGDVLKKIGVGQEYMMLMRGTVPAGFDLAKIGEGDVWVSDDGKRAQITLPAPIIFEKRVVVDLQNSRTMASFDRCPNFLCPNEFQNYKDTVEPETRKRLIAAAQEGGILQQAAEEGKAYYTKMLETLGFEEVRVVVRGYSV